jgi:hypothetical protein
VIKSDPSFESLLYFGGIFFQIVSSFWTNKVVYDSRYESAHDVFHFSIELVQLACLATAVLHIRPVKYMSYGESNPEMFAFCLSIMGGMLCHLIIHLEIRFWGVNGQDNARYAAFTEVLVNLPSFLLVIAATIYSGHLYFSPLKGESSSNYRLLAEQKDGRNDIAIIILYIAYIIRIFIHVPFFKFRSRNKSKQETTVPANVEFIIHRYGEWTMLMLGMSLNALSYFGQCSAQDITCLTNKLCLSSFFIIHDR